MPFFGLQAGVGNYQKITNTHVVTNNPPILTVSHFPLPHFQSPRRSWCRSVCRLLGEQIFTLSIPALRWMGSRPTIETCCLQEIFCPTLSSTSRSSRMEPRRIVLAIPSNSWKLWRQTSLISPNLWSPSSPDLNPIDHKIYSILQERVYRTNIKDVDELYDTALLQDEWDKLDHRVVDKAVGRCRKRLRACVAAGEGLSEHKMWTVVTCDALCFNFQTLSLSNTAHNCMFCCVKCVAYATICKCNILRSAQNIYKICKW